MRLGIQGAAPWRTLRAATVRERLMKQIPLPDGWRIVGVHQYTSYTRSPL